MHTTASVPPCSTPWLSTVPAGRRSYCGAPSATRGPSDTLCGRDPGRRSGWGPPVIEAVLFDIGGVLTTGPFEGFAQYERDQALPEGLIRRINSTDPDTNAWARFERGEVDFAGFRELFEAE